ncbi:MAG TPA: ABC transporter permease [Gemmatimonadales bacterium]|nr:ABC transporter permease [Gemmatimonadales bacterium]
MTFLRRLLARLTGTLRGSQHDAELQEEMAAHLDMAVAENLRRGLAPDEARRQALIAAGGLGDAVETVRDQRGLPWLEHLEADLRYGARTLMRNPGFAGVVAVTLALGIGANTAIFSVIRGVLLRPLPNRDGARLLYLEQSANGPRGPQAVDFSVTEVRDLRAGVPALGGGIAEYSPFSAVLQGDAEATRLSVGLVTGNYFDVMGLAPVLGRLTRPSDDGPGVPPVVVLTNEFWRQHFGADSGIVGTPVLINGQRAEVIGVLQPAPFFPLQMDVLMNMVISPHHLGALMQNNRTHRMTRAVARLAPGATLAQAQIQVATVYARLQKEFPGAYDAKDGYRMSVIPFKRALGQRAQLTLWLLMSTAALVLIIAVASVANLTLMRSVRREHELVVRASLGAGVARLRRLLLVENLLVSTVGAVLGVALATGGVPLLVSLTRRYSPRADEIHLDLPVLGFALALAVGVALLLSLAAFLPSERMLASVSAGGRRSSGGVRKQGLQRGLVVVQVAVSVMLMAGAGLLTRTTLRLSDVPTGLESENVLTLSANLLAANAKQPALAIQDYNRIGDDISAVPGVRLVGVASVMPLRAAGVYVGVTAQDHPLAPGAPVPSGSVVLANADFFAAAGIPVLRGRPFATTDQQSTARVAILNQLLASQLFPGEDPIGRRVQLSETMGMFTDGSRIVVGVSGNTQDGGPAGAPTPTVYLPFAQEAPYAGGFVIRTMASVTDAGLAGIATEATRIVRRNAPTVPVEDVMTVGQFTDQTVAPRRVNAVLVSSFGILAVLIAAVGIAGVLAFGVSARTNEIGIRMSLGAQPGTVERMIITEGGRLVALGVVLGTAGAYASANVIRGLLFGVSPHDPTTFGMVVAMMAVVGLVACWLPASRAARIDPAISLRAN